MFSTLTDFLAALLRATVALSLSAGIAWAALAWFKPQSAGLTRLIWWLVLLQGIILLRIPVAIPWYTAAAPAVVPAPEQTVGFSNRTFNFDDGPHRPESVVAQKADAPIAWQPICFSAWLAGVGMVLVWWTAIYFRVVRCGGRGQTPTEEWLSEWHNLVNNAGVGASIPLLITENTGPLLVWRPRGARMLEPRRLWETLGSGQRLAILRHELAHYRRGDLWKNAVARLLALVHWFNPLAWWVVKNLDECAEWLCDDEAAGANGHTAAEYAEVLLRLGQTPRNHGLWATAMRGGRLHRRICRVLSPAPKERSIMKKSLLVAIPLVLLVGNLIRVELVARAQAPTSPRAESSSAQAAPKTDNPATSQPLPLQRGAMRFVLTPGVQKELGIEPESDQMKAILKLNAQSTQEIEERRKSATEADRANLPRIIGELVAQRDVDLQKLLSPEQQTRIHQILLQKTSTYLALTDPEVAKALELTKDQLEKLVALEKENRDGQTKVFESARQSGPTQELEKKLHEIVANYEQGINETLTKAQQEKYAELKGKPFTGSLAQPNTRPTLSIPSGGLMGVALREAVMKELGIERDSPTFVKLRNLADAHSKLVRQLFSERRQEDRVDMDDIGPKAQAKFDPDLKAALTPEQFKRLRQIYWQEEDIDAFDDPELVKALDVNPWQLEKIKALVIEEARKGTSMAIKNSKSNDSERLSQEQMRKKRGDLRAEYETKISNILTDDQRKTFAELKGKPFDLRSMYQPQPAGAGSDQKNDAKNDK